MKRWWSDNLPYVLTLAVLVGFLVYCNQQYKAASKASKKSAKSETVADHIRHADTYYWFNLAGHGSNAALKGATNQIEDATEKLKTEDLSAEQKAILEKGLAGIEQDIRYQKLLHHDTFHGVFTWSHFMAKPTLFQDVRATGSFELLDQPEVIATRNAVNDLVDKVLLSQDEVAQFDVVFVTDPDDFPEEKSPSATRLSTQLENEALYLFNLNPRFFVHNMLEVERSLSDEEQQQLNELQPTPEVLEKLRELWGNRDILVVRLKRMDEVNRHHFWSAQGRLFHETDPVPVAVYNNYGLCRDRTHMLGTVLFFNLLMAVAAIVLFRFLSGVAAHTGQSAPWKVALGLGGIGFLWGRVSVWGLVELVERFVPPDETLAIVSFWWPALTGFVILFGPGFVARFAEERFGWLAKAFGTYNRGGAMFAVVSMGSVTYVGQAALWVRTWGGWSVLPPLIIATVFAAWIIGRALDHTEPVKRGWALPMIVMGLLIGPAFSHSYPSWQHLWGLWLTAIPVCFIGTFALIRSGNMVRFLSHKETETAEEGPIESVSTLVRRIQNPPFKTTKSFKTVMQALREGQAGHHGPTAVWVDKSNLRMQIIGPAGIGKTALLKAVRSAVAKQDDATVMAGDCPEPTEGAEHESYRPFADAIADHFAVNLLLPPQSQIPGLDKAIDGIFEEVVPFSDLLFPPTHSDGASGSKTELFNSIAIMIRHLAEKRRVIFIIDDAHWIDDASRELLEFLMTEFPADGDSGIALIVSSRTKLAGFAESETVILEKLSEEEINNLLKEGLKFSSVAAQELSAAVSEEEGNMHWLFQMINYLADKNVLTWQGSGFGWDSKTNLSDHVPNDLLRSLELMLESHPQFRRVLECASCIGPKFTVEVLSQSLKESRLETIHMLDQIEHKTGIVRDLQHQDDSFEFRSSFILEVLRRLLGVNSHGPNKPSPQRIREYHARLANAWQETLTQSSAALFRLATHRFAAGVRHANLAVEDTVGAARAASAQYQHDQARKYIAMARECVSAAGLEHDNLERELLLIECHEAHVEGRHRKEMAERALAMLDTVTESDFEIYAAAALANYDAGIDTRDQHYFAECVSIGERIVEKFTTPVEQAEGHHFIGIGLSRDEFDLRRKHLEAAMELIEKAGDEVTALRVKSRIANSLAELLGNGNEADQLAARELFMTSIELKSRPDIRDVQGLAFAHGGLGRLAFYADEVDIDDARKHFEEDLRYSEKIGSLAGQTKMRSMLAACDLFEARQEQDTKLFGQALEKYESAYRLMEAQFDMFFALAGIVECYEVLGDQTKADEYGEALVELVQSRVKSLSEEDQKENPIAAIPSPCVDSIRHALRQCGGSTERKWHHWMMELVEHNRIAVSQK